MSMRLFIFLLAMVVVEARDQSIWAIGRVSCQGKPESGFAVEIWDHDIADPDDKMGEGVTTADGSFNVTGFTESKSDITPYMKFFHNCSGGSTQVCSKVVIPSTCINDGPVPTHPCDLVTVEMHDRVIDC